MAASFKKLMHLLLVVSNLFGWSHSLEIPNDGKLRVCIVEANGMYRKTPKFCPILEATSNIECVVGVDRLDCVRRIHKGTAHFGVLNSEELVAARWAGVEILITNELRSHSSDFEYQIVAVVDNEADINSVHDLRGAKLCHPGYGLGNHWTEVLGNYFESTLISKSCDPEISLVEDKIQASANYFGPSCKAGPWVVDRKQDSLLKQRYPSLCELCNDPYSCDIGDKFWGRRGALYCLTNGGGNVAYARLDDVKSHFGFSGVLPQADSSTYSYLCPDGHLQPINTTNPCTWVAKPWPVVAAKRSHAAKIQTIVTGLSHDDPGSWENALLNLLETFHIETVPLDNLIPIDDYLDQAPGFQSAYSFPECNPPRAIVYCTTSIIQHIKCSWLQEASQVYGVQPNIQCIRSSTLDSCMDDIKFRAADVVLVDHENRIRAQRDYKLIPLLYEFSHNMHERYATIALVHRDAKFEDFQSLKGMKACLPSYEGPAYLSVLETIYNTTGTLQSVHSYFGKKSCSWHPKSHSNCPDYYKGDEGALRCLAEGGDVAFLSSDVYKKYTVGNLTGNWLEKLNHKGFKVLCPFGGQEHRSKFEYCYLHWTTRGHLMTHNTSVTRMNEIYNSLRDMDLIFGKAHRSEVRHFTMYGIFDKRNNVMFRDNTDGLFGLQDMKKDNAKRIMEDIFFKYTTQYYEEINSSYSNANRNTLNSNFIFAINFCLLLVANIFYLRNYF